MKCCRTIIPSDPPVSNPFFIGHWGLVIAHCDSPRLRGPPNYHRICPVIDCTALHSSLSGAMWRGLPTDAANGTCTMRPFQ
ncbi:hypothetical protein K2D_09430 [Planctomycetes bacterium K2D]|uniref:Uncharacterized protein n=1 Tax=Botrimarina mediterranea TaxID=2528022 RepID=A0A518K4Q7_9BACT|nr:hypothetical protein Spa11_09600 [Botrimarina mediterranea]QDV77352.1 hypothetical protein K2D_09430 [Planctomycetes bacterium K2D]